MLSGTLLLFALVFPNWPVRLRDKRANLSSSLSSPEGDKAGGSGLVIFCREGVLIMNLCSLRHSADPAIHRPPLKCFPHCSLTSCSFLASELREVKVLLP